MGESERNGLGSKHGKDRWRKAIKDEWKCERGRREKTDGKDGRMGEKKGRRRKAIIGQAFGDKGEGRRERRIKEGYKEGWREETTRKGRS